MKKTIALLAFAFTLSACSKPEQPLPQVAPQYAQPAQVQYAPAPQPVIIQQQAAPASSGFNTGDAAIGALAGAAAMHALSNRQPAAVAPQYAPSQRYYQPTPQRSVVTTTVRKTATGSVTRTTTRRR